ncbi:MAG: methylamine utilization protein, partial [Pseudomonadota bacterium]
MKSFIYTGLISLAIVASPVMSAEHEVGQKNKEFTVKEIRIKVGDTVKFTNEDPFFHNIYSLSDIKTFDLGSYPKGESRS